MDRQCLDRLPSDSEIAVAPIHRSYRLQFEADVCERMVQLLRRVLPIDSCRCASAIRRFAREMTRPSFSKTRRVRRTPRVRRLLLTRNDVHSVVSCMRQVNQEQASAGTQPMKRWSQDRFRMWHCVQGID